MRSSRRPTVEPMEGRTLMSTVPVSGAIPSSSAVSQVPLTYLAVPLARPRDLSSSVTTDQSTYQAGQSINVTFTETNISNHPVTVIQGPGIKGLEAARPHGKLVWRSDNGIHPEYIQSVVLQPNQSVTTQATWDGRNNLSSLNSTGEESAPLTGTFEVFAQRGKQAPATITIEPPAVTTVKPVAKG